MGIRRTATRSTRQGLAALRRAFARAYGIRDERGYGYFAGLHGLPLPAYCPHHTLLFLPWHRAYLYFFERALQDLEPGADLPWWDWTSTVVPPRRAARGVPADAGAGQPQPAGDRTGAAVGRRPRSGSGGDPDNRGAISDGPLPWTLRDPGVPDELPRADDRASCAGEPVLRRLLGCWSRASTPACTPGWAAR